MGVGVQLREWSNEQFKVKVSPDLILAVSTLLRPAALTAIVFGVWRLTADMSWTKDFPIPEGLFSHWQVWVAMGVLLQMAARTLGRSLRTRKH